MGSIKKYYQYAVLATGLIALGIITWSVSGNFSQSDSTSKNTVVNQASETKDRVSFTANGNETVLDQLKAVNSNVVTKETELGAYVDSINGLKGGTDGKYWTYYVNGTMGSVGADAYVPKKGETIEWKFQS